MQEFPAIQPTFPDSEAGISGGDAPGGIRFCAMEPDGDWDALTELLHVAYREHSMAGRNYTACAQTVEQTQRRCHGNVCLLAFAGGALAGTITLAGREKGGVPYGYVMQVAVAPPFRQLGLGRQLLSKVEETARSKGYAYLICDTASTATKLVAWYVKQGWVKTSCCSHSSTNYYSTVLRKNLQGQRGTSRRWGYLLNCLKCRLLWKANGSLRIWGKVAKAVRNKLRGKRAES